MAAGVLELCWEPTYRYCAPNLRVYPWQWLWDSAFHSIIWCALGDDRAELELVSLFDHQTESGLVAHMGYQRDPSASIGLWKVRGRSSITQPPMFGHAIRTLLDAGFPLSESLVDDATRSLRFLADNRRGPHGLTGITHPWESGADDSPRWEPWYAGSAERFDRDSWMHTKLAMVESLELDSSGAAVRNPRFEAYPASFNALVAFNAAELAAISADDFLLAFAIELGEAIDELWDPLLGTWADVDHEGVTTSSALTLDSLLPVLVTPDEAKVDLAAEHLLDPDLFGAAFGPTAVSQSEAAFDPAGYWRGSSWPHLSYLTWLALSRRRRTEAAARIKANLVAATLQSRMSEHVHAFTGEGLGAQPQGWAGLAIVPTDR
jgi:hypothetical protein